MPVVIPRTLDAALATIADTPDAILLAGGTDLMVQVNERHRSLTDDALVVPLGAVPELSTWTVDQANQTLTIGATIKWSEIEREPIASIVPALAQAARTVGSPQIRNAGTIGGNLATCSPAGDGLPVLHALGATVLVASAGSTRRVAIDEFIVGVKRTALQPGELVTGVEIPLGASFQGFRKIGPRNAMVIAVANACVVIRADRRVARIALGSVGPTIIGCPAAETLLAERIDWETGAIDSASLDEVVSAVREAAQPITDHRSTAGYRRHAVGVLVRRLLNDATATWPSTETEADHG